MSCSPTKCSNLIIFNNGPLHFQVDSEFGHEPCPNTDSTLRPLFFACNWEIVCLYNSCQCNADGLQPPTADFSQVSHAMQMLSPLTAIYAVIGSRAAPACHSSSTSTSKQWWHVHSHSINYEPPCCYEVFASPTTHQKEVHIPSSHKNLVYAS